MKVVSVSRKIHIICETQRDFNSLRAAPHVVSPPSILYNVQFHQANAIPTSLSGGSLLAHWYESVMEKMTSLISFPVTSSKFDDLCTDFQLHEALDESDVVLTATLDNASGDVSDVSLSSSGTVGYVPFTVPSGSAIPTSGLIVGDTKVYGSDTTYYVTTSAKAVPTVASAPSEDELATVPTITGTTWFDSALHTISDLCRASKTVMAFIWGTF